MDRSRARRWTVTQERTGDAIVDLARRVRPSALRLRFARALMYRFENLGVAPSRATAVQLRVVGAAIALDDERRPERTAWRRIERYVQTKLKIQRRRARKVAGIAAVMALTLGLVGSLHD